MVLGSTRMSASFAGALRGDRVYRAGWDDTFSGVVVEYQLSRQPVAAHPCLTGSFFFLLARAARASR